MKVLIIDEMHESIVPLLEQIGITPYYQPTITRTQILECIGQYEGLIMRSKTPLDLQIIERAVKLRFVGRAGAGIDNIDTVALAQRNIPLFTAAEGNKDAVAEHAVGMLLCLLNKIHTADRQVRNLEWHREANRGVELMYCTVAIIGYGNMGSNFAKRLSGFGCKVIAYDLKQNYADAYALETNMEQIFEEADILSIHIPLNAENKKIFTEKYFQKFKKNIFLINTARGELIENKTIANLLRTGKLRGAALDVLENEKLSTMTDTQREAFMYLAESPQVVFSPHVAGWTVESYRKINEVLVDKIKRLS
jgi:D-3-phosphoglycerate dehydrogenase